MQCEDCRFWEDHGDEEDAKPRQGSCLRYPPVRNMAPDTDDAPMYSLWSFPVTGGHWWCGEFAVRQGATNG